MLTYLKIKNFALIEDAEIEFGNKFNVITGESGSGKSIIFGALSLLFGERADKNIIRSNSDRCEVCAILKLNSQSLSKINTIFAENDLDTQSLENSELQIRRIISASTSRNYVNDSTISSKLLQKISSLFFDFNQPDDELSLNSRTRQLELLDKFANLNTQTCAQLYHELIDCQKAISNFDKTLPNTSELEEANNLVNTFELLNPSENEDETLVNRHKILANAQEIISISSNLVNGLTGDENSTIDLMATILRELYQLNKLSENTAANLVNDAELISESIRTLSIDLEKFVSNIEIDGEEFNQLENRIAEIHKLKRNFGPTLNDVFNNYEAAKNTIELFRNSRANRAALVAEELKLKNLLDSECQKLSSERQQKAIELKSLMIKELEQIGFANCRLEWIFEKTTPSAIGNDAVDIIFSANKGEDLHPLRQIASSGERSRLFLAIKSVLARVDDIPTVIFDEIDANIGGDTANKVALALANLAEFRQVILISHLAQVAAKANTHLKVSKVVTDNRTYSQVEILNDTNQIDEIARLLGGSSKLDIARLHAKELLHKTSTY